MNITIITEENRSFFTPLMPDSLWNEADLVLGAIEEGVACGVIAAVMDESLLFIQHLFVDVEFRRKGAATALLEGLHRFVAVSKPDAAVCQYVQNQSTDGLTQCLVSNLFEQDELKNPVYVTRFGDLSKKLFETKTQKAAGQLRPLSQVTGKVWNSFINHLEKLPNSEGTVPELKEKSAYDQEAGFLLMHQEEAAGCILFEKQEKDYILSFFCILGQVKPAEMMGMFQASYRVLRNCCGDDTKIYINTLTKTTQKMVLQMTDGKAQMVGEAVTLYYVY